MAPLSRGTMRPRFAFVSPSSRRRAQGKPGADCTRGRAPECTSRPQGNRINPAFPAQWCYGLLRARPGVPSSLAPVVPELTMHPKPGRAGCISQNLTPDRGVRPTRLRRPRPSLLNAPRGLAARAEFWQKQLAAPFVARRMTAHGNTALRSLARPTLSRPSHPTAQFVTTRDPPLSG